MCLKERATTKPGSLLKSLIPTRTSTEWNGKRPGFVEMDTVAHCGETSRGQYIVTLDVTAIHTCWPEQRAAQKNWSIVHQTIGYGRFESKREYTLLNMIYDRLRLLTNLFMPSQKLVSKGRDGGRVICKLDHPLTLYRRVLASEHVGGKSKVILRRSFWPLESRGASPRG